MSNNCPNLCRNEKRNWKHGEIYLVTKPAYFLVHLDYVKNVLTKDFQYFVDRHFYSNKKDDPLSVHLVALGGVKWKHLRTEKMLMEYKKRKTIDVKEILGCFTTDCIGSCAFGLDCKTFYEENSPFRVCGKQAFNWTKYMVMRFTLSTNFPNLVKNLGATVFPRNVTNFFMKVVKDTIHLREKNSCTRNDFMQLLIELKNNKHIAEDGYQEDGQSLTIEEIAAQCFVFFLAGFKTFSTTMTFALYELAKDQQIQDKVRKEINIVLTKHDGKLTYESIQDMKYMNQVIDETLRKYPPIPAITRKCVKDYKIPDKDVFIEKGTTVIVLILGIHYDKEYYPDSEKFDPERFSEENKASRHNYAHLPFGECPRICIGMRFGQMQSKVSLTSLLRNYRFTVNKKTKEPLTMQVNVFTLAAEGEIWMDAEKIGTS